MLKILMVGTGGFAGSICRYMIAVLTNKLLPNAFLPYGTLTANVLGCLLIGFLGGIFETRHVLTPEIRALVLVGFLGGFTTFSTFGHEIFSFAKHGHFFQAAAHLFSHLILGLGAVGVGFFLSTKLT